MSTAFTLSELSLASGRRRTVNESRAAASRTAFLCHSHKDRVYAIGLKTILEEQGVSLYVDWIDDPMPDRPTRETADHIRRKIGDSHLFLFLATPNSMASRWCPWELGIADSRKGFDHIAIVPTQDGTTFYGNEYLLLYRRLEMESVYSYGTFTKRAQLFSPNSSTGTYL
ncbi:toll/interleukin-1 receptor domain-containing protein [Oleiharenicola lentus]|uniref:toll/interleukin-1 receptor domain-containing protein n=1 Tax=Oleiharenicola lentus TaxID=2508720 RepID=UPI003F678120